MSRKIVLTTISSDMICRHCGKGAKLYWYDMEMTNGSSETLYRDMHSECFESVYHTQTKTLQELNDERKNLRQ